MRGVLPGRNLNPSQLFLEADRGLPLATGQEVRVDRERNRRRAVAQALRHELEVVGVALS